jgi:anti-anti-sigma factor
VCRRVDATGPAWLLTGPPGSDTTGGIRRGAIRTAPGRSTDINTRCVLLDSFDNTREVMSVSKSDGETQPGRSFSCIAQRLATNTTIVRATGDLNGETSSQLYALVADELARDPAQLVLELSDATPVDNAAVEALGSASALAGEADISFCLVASHTGPIVIALAAAELIEWFEIFPTVDEAERNR